MTVEIGRGPLVRMRVSLPGSGGKAALYSLPFDAIAGTMNDLLGEYLQLTYLDRISCCACARASRKSYGGGYCYECFKSLARCDLCIVSPDRCHYAKGTCREPDWGRSFCMQDHIVYLANSAGLKVGVTRSTNIPGRWLDQGASQALPIIDTTTRERAGWVERALARYVNDRTDWRALVSRPPKAIDLAAEASQLKRQASAALAEVSEQFPEGIEWRSNAESVEFHYPVESLSPPARLSLAAAGAGDQRGAQRMVAGRLQGIRGQYLLFDEGVFNVSRHTSYHVSITRGAPPASRKRREQLSLFD